MARRLDTDEVAAALDALSGWHGDGDLLERTFRYPTFPVAVSAVDQVAVVAEEMNHHPDIDIRWRSVRFGLSTHDAGGVTQLDVELAHRITEISSALGGS
jgi:4a-hydroxytetrahydrobiopterin dehydratase